MYNLSYKKLYELRQARVDRLTKEQSDMEAQVQQQEKQNARNKIILPR